MKTLDRFQFKKEEVSKNCLMTLERYAEIMMAYPYEVSPNAWTLWIPAYSSNRSARINLNHGINGFGEDGFLYGENGNCMTPYIVILVAPGWTQDTVNLLAEKLVNKLNLTQYKECPITALKTSRINEIIDLIIEDKELH